MNEEKSTAEVACDVFLRALREMPEGEAASWDERLWGTYNRLIDEMLQADDDVVRGDAEFLRAVDERKMREVREEFDRQKTGAVGPSP